LPIHTPKGTGQLNALILVRTNELKSKALKLSFLLSVGNHYLTPITAPHQGWHMMEVEKKC